MLALAAITTLAFAPLTPSLTPVSTVRAGGIACTAISGRREMLKKLAGGAAAATLLASSPALADDRPIDSYYMDADDEKKQSIVLAVLSCIILFSPIIGIQMARGAISTMVKQDSALADSFVGDKDPEWSITPGARRKQKQRELQAKLDAEQAKKPFWQR